MAADGLDDDAGLVDDAVDGFADFEAFADSVEDFVVPDVKVAGLDEVAVDAV